MRSEVLHLTREVPSPRDLIAGTRPATPEARPAPSTFPDFVCAFLPPGEHLQATLDAMAEAWPASLRFGCEAVTQFVGDAMTSTGGLHMFWLDDPRHRVEVHALSGTPDRPPAAHEVTEVLDALDGADGVFVLSDGLRFPHLELLAAIRARFGEGGPLVVGGLASQREPIESAGARVFLDRQVLADGCLVLVLRGIEMVVEVVRGWDPASPIYTVTEAEGNVLRAIDGEPATDWFRRFFAVDGALAPMPESAHRFPLIIQGPDLERAYVYRSMKGFDDPPGAVTFWGDLKVGDRVRLGIGNDTSLLRTAARLPPGEPPEAALLYSCVGREAVLGELADREVATISRALGRTALSGFFTFGEIGPAASGHGPAFYNQTAILALLRERREA
jgi:hypothetical protein